MSRDRLDDVPHGEGACAEHGPDGLPVSLEVSPGQEGPGGIVGHRAQHGAHILTADLGLVQSHPQVTANISALLDWNKFITSGIFQPEGFTSRDLYDWEIQYILFW